MSITENSLRPGIDPGSIPGQSEFSVIDIIVKTLRLPRKLELEIQSQRKIENKKMKQKSRTALIVRCKGCI